MPGIVSLSARRAWIEISLLQCQVKKYSVALRKESVDRNIVSAFDVLAVSVALRKESVDRNSIEPVNLTVSTTSLSARRAWIEIIMFVNLRVLDGCRSPQGERG